MLDRWMDQFILCADQGQISREKKLEHSSSAMRIQIIIIYFFSLPLYLMYMHITLSAKDVVLFSVYTIKLLMGIGK